ncbi:MAG: VTT domain-containing protein [Patescibacteria group bacterium]|nr:VTT domain-containing protein [Patescibacteria group bacterium]
MYTVHALSRLIEHNKELAYLVIFLVTIIEGEIIAISAGILILLGALNFWICFLLIFFGGMTKTFLGYSLGGFLRNKFENSKFFQYIEKKVFSIMPRFNQKPFWSIFISKFIIGLNHLVIVFSGYQKINFKTYLRAELLSTVLWVPFMLSLGYFFSYAALHVSRRISEFSLVIIIFIILFFLLDKLISLLYDVFENT